MAGTQSKGLHLVLYLCCAEPGSPTQITHFGSTTLNFVGSKGQIDTGRRMQQLGELGCSLGCTFSQHCKERWGLFADRLTWIPTPRDERLQFPKQHCHVQQLLPTPSTARGKPRCAPSSASPAHSWGRAVSASHPSALDPRSEPSRDMETSVSMLQKSMCRMEDAQWRSTKYLGSSAPGAAVTSPWTWQAMTGLTGRIGAKQGRSPTFCGQAGPGSGFALVLAKGAVGSLEDLAFCLCQKSPAAEYWTQTLCMLKTAKISDFWVCYMS